MKKPVALIILDGFGISNKIVGNAVKAAKLPNFDRISSQYPKTQIEASGLAVGLPEGQMGNSEVGHLNIGAGRIVYQELTRITREIELGDFFKNPVLVEAMNHAKENGKQLHLMGLVSPGGVHSHTQHLYGLLKLAKELQVKDVLVHCFLDGRDTPPQSALDYITELEEQIKTIGVGKIATVIGRYYAMDRDQRWERTEVAYDAVVSGIGRVAPSAIEAVQQAYDLGEMDEFVKPTVIGKAQGEFGVEAGDAVIFFNFRPDRARQMTRALTDPAFAGFERKKGYQPLHYVCMTQYDKTLEGVHVAYAPQSLKNTLGEFVSQQGKQQLRIAETEKYAHVTYFFNGGIEQPYPLEERKLIPSPKVATYDLKPEMSAEEVTSTLLSEIDKDIYDLIVVNFANPDMVGHTGVFEAVVKALETVDNCLGQVLDKILEKGGCAIVTADHGNAEELLDESTGTPITSHTTNPVPLILVGAGDVELLSGGKLCDIAPTLLQLMGLEKPGEMTGNSLIK